MLEHLEVIQLSIDRQADPVLFLILNWRIPPVRYASITSLCEGMN